MSEVISLLDDLKLVGDALDARSRAESANKLLLIDVDRQTGFSRDHQTGFLVNLDVDVRPGCLCAAAPINRRLCAIQPCVVCKNGKLPHVMATVTVPEAIRKSKIRCDWRTRKRNRFDPGIGLSGGASGGAELIEQTRRLCISYRNWRNCWNK
jgi:hypothetical protein